MGHETSQTATVTVTVVAAPTPTPVSAPVVTVAPKVAGFPIVGTRLTCPNTVTGATATTTKWNRGTTVVATTAGYLVTTVDRTRSLTCTVTATGPGGTTTATSAARTVPGVCRVPATRGLTILKAKTALANRGCRSTVTRLTGTGVAVGRVLGTTPGAGIIRANGTTITCACAGN